ncbi:STAS domain-containing protein [Streptomyces sp. NPDC059063]|uniref:STAS domain-containing protein n=1 Tax=unclassified Streptomyces TaxID=2593676 RepID=UPI0036AED946
MAPNVSLLTSQRCGAATLVTLHGEIDVLTAPELTGALMLSLNGESPDLLVDLRSVQFIDGTGLAALAVVRRRADSRHGRMRLICTRPITLWVLRHPRLGFDFEVLDDIPAA